MFFSYKKGKNAGEETPTSSSNLFPILEFNPYSSNKTESGGDSNSYLFLLRLDALTEIFVYSKTFNIFN